MRYPRNTIRFESKPSREILESLKSWGFSYRNGAWSAPQSIESATVIDCLKSGCPVNEIPERVAERGMEADLGII